MSNGTSIHDWPLAERPREKLLARGGPALSDAELLAIFLRSGTRGRTAVDVARGLLSEFGGLRGVLSRPLAELGQTSGVGPAKYAQLQAALELGRRYLAEPFQRGEPLTSPPQVRKYLRAWLTGREREIFVALFLDNRHRMLAAEELFAGTIDGATVHPRELVKRALSLNSAAVIVAHNHPSGIAEPSHADQLLTTRLRDALALVDIRLLDHIVVGDVETVSLSERGLL